MFFGTQKSEVFVPFGLPWAPLGLSLGTSGRQSRKSKKKGSLPAGKCSQFLLLFWHFLLNNGVFSGAVFQTLFFIDFRALWDPSKP